ncbi:MAG TPA: homoserine kinase [Acidimicrobiales bacterium]|nr:homoserine kinase [Acidimicrobiales bacterium]
MRVRAPASSANLGPGFDTLALAVDRYVSVEVEPAAALRVYTEGEGAGLFDDASHLAARVVAEVLGHDRFSVSVRSQIPVARGLGSSAALAVAAAAAAGSDDPFAVAAAYDGHPENAAASVFGGLVAATSVEGVPAHAALPLAGDLEVVAIVPDRNLATPEARGVLPDRFSREDAVFNLGRMGLLVAGLADPSALRREATEDRIHQTARTALFPEAPQLLAALVEAGALAACWSGAGPTLIGFVTPDAVEAVRAGAGAALAETGMEGRVLSLRPDRRGLVYGDEAAVPLDGVA